MINTFKIEKDQTLSSKVEEERQLMSDSIKS